MKAVWISSILALAVWVVAAGLFGVGCDSVPSADSILEVSPASVVATGRVFQVFVVANTNLNAVLPLDWSVSDAGLGTIASEGGVQALYTGTGAAGLNTITVRDQADAEGFAVISHLYSRGLAVTPGTTNINAGAVVSFAAVVQTAGEGGEPIPGDTEDLALPLEWSVSNSDLGVIVAAGTLDAVYSSTGLRGVNIVTVRDQSGAAATAVVTQE